MRRLLGWLRVALVDLRGGLARFGILIACLALGVAAIGTVSAVRSSVETAVARDSRVILGGDLEIRSFRTDLATDVVTALDGLGQVSREVEINAQASANGQSAFLTLRAVTQAYPLVGSVTVAPGAEPGPASALLPPRDNIYGLLLGQQAAQRLGVSPGDTVRIGTLDFALRGIIMELPDQATAGFQLGAPALVSAEALAPAGLREEGVLSQFRYKLLLRDGDIEAARNRLERQFPDHDWQIRSPSQATATIERFIAVFGNFMLLVALSSMIVGGLGAANAVTAYVGERQGAIATMRALGARSPRILVHFLAQIAALSLLATLIGLVIVVIATLALLPLLSDLIGLDLPAVLDLRAMLVAGAIGLVTALLFSWIPLRQAQAVRPALLFRSGASGAPLALPWRALLAPGLVLPLLAGFVLVVLLTLQIANDWRLVGVYFAATLLAFGLLRLAAAGLAWLLRRLPPPRQRLLRQASSAIIRPGAPTTTVLVSMGMGLSLLLLIVTTQSNINSQISGEVTAEAPAFVLFDMDRATADAVTGFAATTPAIEQLTTFPMLRGTVTQLKDGPPPSADDVPPELAGIFRGDTALSWSAALPDKTVLAEGEWWPTAYDGPPLVSLTTELRDGLGLALGDTITLSIAGRPLTFTIANFRATDRRSAAFSFDILASPGLIEKAPQSYFSTVMAAPADAPGLEAALVSTFPQLRFVPVGDALSRVQSIFDGLVNAIALVSATAVVAGILVLAGALSVGRRQREADAVLMKVLGARRGQVIAAFMLEYALLGAIAALVAGVIALTGAWAAANFLLDIDFAVQPGQLALLTLLVVAVTTLTGAATTWSAMSTRPADRLREEG